MSDLFEPKFDANQIYEPDDFIFRIEIILTEVSPSEKLHQVLQNWLTWARQHSSDCQIAFMPGQNGSIEPFCIETIRIKNSSR